MLREQELLVVERRIEVLQFTCEQPALEQLLAEPDRERLDVGGKAARGAGEISFDQPLELEERLVVEHDVIDVLERRAGGIEAILDRAAGKALVEFLARKALLLRGGDHAPILDQRGGAVVIEGGDSEQAHVRSAAARS